MHRRRHRSMRMIATVAAMGLTAVAWGRGPGRPFGEGALHDGPGFMHDGPGLGGGMLLQRLIFPCRADCFDADRDCVETAISTAESCAAAACATQVTAAQTACQDRTSDACDTAIADLKTCASTCLETGGSDLAACRETLSTCFDTCGTP